MKVTKAQAAENRAAMVHAAAAQIRGRGFAQVSGTEVAKAAGLTHGALYSHFGSTEALAVEATKCAFEESAHAFDGLSSEEFLARYLSPEHRDNPEVGCPNAALASEVWRQPLDVQRAFRDGLQRFVAITAKAFDADRAGVDSDKAVTIFAALVGGVALSRAVRNVDGPASDEILRAVSSQIAKMVRPDG